ncbi:hypothetical protein LWI29_010309 [Acer saccharum]|uniref:Uncharacterized protein n=1 Tax=Acer saccharum TaxID=4024 RepID=A0AA39T433_ACESA|nr:hypothetical protein LWI29_010309 [Acer saccharum]
MSCMHRWSDKLELKNVVVWRDKCVSCESQLPCKDSITSLPCKDSITSLIKQVILSPREKVRERRERRRGRKEGCRGRGRIGRRPRIRRNAGEELYLLELNPRESKERGNLQPSASDIDYMSQFSNGGASNQKGTQKVNNNRSTTRGRNSRASGGWVDPKSSATIPKDAGKRRVHASGGQSAGHWYTSPEGRKVYMSKNGQELTGQIAYRQYRKENGAGFRKSKKKTNSRKKKTKS